MAPPLVQLASYGPGWAMLAVFAGVLMALGLGICGLLKWILEKQYAVFREDHRDARTFTAAAIEALRDIKSACERCHLSTISTVKIEMGNVADRVISAVWSADEQVMASARENNANLVNAIGREATRTISEINMALLRQENGELSRPHALPPPAVGSQVRDSAVRVSG